MAQLQSPTFQGWDFFVSGISYLSINGETRANITLNLRNLTSNSAQLTDREYKNIKQIKLVDAKGNTYPIKSMNAEEYPYLNLESNLRSPFFLGEIRSLALTFNTPLGLIPEYLEIPRLQGQPIRLKI